MSRFKINVKVTVFNQEVKKKFDLVDELGFEEKEAEEVINSSVKSHNLMMRLMKGKVCYMIDYLEM